MTENEIRKIVSETVDQTLTRLGVDATNPIEFQKDMAHVRQWRESIDTVKRQSIMSAVGVITIGILGAIWLAFRGTGNA